MEKEAEEKPILAVFSDLHAGSRAAIFPRKFTIDKLTFQPSRFQREFHDHWVRCWSRIAEIRKKRRLIIVALGDMTEGMHHNTTELISNDPLEHVNIAGHLIDEAMQIANYGKDDKFYLVGGTPSHDGENWRYAQLIASDLGAVPYRNHQDERQRRHVWPRLKASIGGVIFDMIHDGFTIGRRAWTSENTMNSMAKSVYLDCLESKQKVPRVMISAHVHRHKRITYYGRKNTIDAYVCPSWQAKTTFGNRAAKFSTMADIGMMAFDGVDSEIMIMQFEQDRVIAI